METSKQYARICYFFIGGRLHAGPFDANEYRLCSRQYLPPKPAESDLRR
jgi:hypothetical protein